MITKYPPFILSSIVFSYYWGLSTTKNLYSANILCKHVNMETAELILQYFSTHPYCISIEKDSAQNKARYRVRIKINLKPIWARRVDILNWWGATIGKSQKETDAELDKRCGRGQDFFRFTDAECRPFLEFFSAELIDNPRAALCLELLDAKTVGRGPGRGNKTTLTQAGIYERYAELK